MQVRAYSLPGGHGQRMHAAGASAEFTGWETDPEGRVLLHVQAGDEASGGAARRPDAGRSGEDRFYNARLPFAPGPALGNGSGARKHRKIASKEAFLRNTAWRNDDRSGQGHYEGNIRKEGLTRHASDQNFNCMNREGAKDARRPEGKTFSRKLKFIDFLAIFASSR